LLGWDLLGSFVFMVGDRLGLQNGHANMERALLVYTTYPSIVEAERAGRSIVEQRLAACVNILPGMVSHYWWQGAIERGEEVVMIIKTRASLTDRVCAAVKAGHSYTTPAIMVLPIERLEPGYLEWLMAETAAATAGI
jgi:periplasmic divalent cation tolerance protein